MSAAFVTAENGGLLYEAALWLLPRRFLTSKHHVNASIYQNSLGCAIQTAENGQPHNAREGALE